MIAAETITVAAKASMIFNSCRTRSKALRLTSVQQQAKATFKVKKTTKARKKKTTLVLKGDVVQDDLLIGSHGNTDMKITGTFLLSGIIYCPKYTVTLVIQGDGRIAFRGKCHRIVIKKMQGDCMLDLSDVTYKELHCQSLSGKSVVIAGNTRAISPAILSEDATLHVHDRHLLFNPVTSGNARILSTTGAVVKEEVG